MYLEMKLKFSSDQIILLIFILLLVIIENT